MKTLFILFHCICFHLSLLCQVINEQQLERIAEAGEVEIGDDSYLQELDHYRKHPIDLNKVDLIQLSELNLFTTIQVQNFLNYRKLMGPLIHIYELQAIPGWDPGLIRKIIPFLTINPLQPFEKELRTRLRGGDQFMLLKISRSFSKSEKHDHKTYRGGPQHVILRYQYNYRNSLQYGILGEKDAGEQFLKGAQKIGFDFYSFHFFMRRTGWIHSLALGDFTANLGQGLIHWQSMAFKKSADVVSIKRHSAVLKPYRSSGEYYFNRGAGLTLKKKQMEASLFFSFRKLDANKQVDTNGVETISSFISSGYHRLESEMLSKKMVSQFSSGISILWKKKNAGIGINGIYHKFSLPLRKRDEPYNLYAVEGKNWYNLSMDYSYTWRNLHFFGETALSKQRGLALLHGVLISMDKKFDLCFLHRSIGSNYQSLYGNAFTESTTVSNENGLYAGFSFRPTNNWLLNGYADHYKFPWLKSLVDANSRGRNYLLQVVYSPSKNMEITARYRDEVKLANGPGGRSPNYGGLVPVQHKGWRLHYSLKVNPSVTVRNRVEILSYTKKGSSSETGWLSFIDFLIKPALKPWNAALRFQFFETDGYNSRIFAFENDVLFSHSIPAFFNQGLRCYLAGNYDLLPNLGCWIKISSTISKGQIQMDDKKETALSLLLRFMF